MGGGSFEVGFLVLGGVFFLVGFVFGRQDRNQKENMTAVSLATKFHSFPCSFSFLLTFEISIYLLRGFFVSFMWG